jgi:penicillin-binding protein 1A
MGGPVAKPAFFYPLGAETTPILTKHHRFSTMTPMPAPRKVDLQLIARIFIVLTAVFALCIGIAAGVMLAVTRNEINSENFSDFRPALPTKILDINGNKITEFSSDEMREMISIEELPKYLVGALVCREDKHFYEHNGFYFPSFMRAVVGVVINRNLGGGSTITQQVAGTLMADRDNKTITRKIVELWWAFQFERRYTKSEILELFLNKMYYGDGYYGVEAASKYFFGKSSREVTPAEAAVLVLQPSTIVSGRYNPFKNPESAKKRSRIVLDDMVGAGYCTKAEADASFSEYWDNFDYTRVPVSAYFNREDKARYFSEYVRRELENQLYGSIDYNKDGLTINTTLNLSYQEFADSIMSADIKSANDDYKASSSVRLQEADSTYIPIVNALSVLFDLGDLRSAEARAKAQMDSRFQNQINPVIDASALLFGLPGLKDMTKRSYEKAKTAAKKTNVQGALISIDNETGYILSMVGGAGYSTSDQNIRAVDATIQPGSCFKPLYYSAAIDTRKYTMASLIYDEPIVFRNPDGTPYVPLNHKGEWKGPVLLWYALSKSMNVPSLRVLDGIGFDAAINRASALLGIKDQAKIAATFPRVYPLGLGVITTSPVQMAKAFSTFANGGKEVTPIAIRSIVDRDGGVIRDLEKELRVEQKKKGQGIQVVSPQNAYIMTELLSRVVATGTLSGYGEGGALLTYTKDGQKYTIPTAGKTGTTQNWADAWTVGFSPYMTTAIWFGFDSPGNSLGIDQTGAAIAGKAWASYMRNVHRGLADKEFPRPQTGLIDVTVCAKSGQLPTDYCTDGTIKLSFLEGTQPKALCTLHSFSSERDMKGLETITGAAGMLDSDSFTSGNSGDTILHLDDSLFGTPAPSTGSLLD